MTPIGQFGADTGAAVLGVISAIAVNAEELFVFDRSTCEVVVFARSDRTVRRRFGRCGKGPTDLEYVTSLALSGDTLLLADRAGASLSLWSTAGRPLTSHRLTLRDSAWTRAQFIGPVGRRRIGLSLELLGNRDVGTKRVLRSQGTAHFRVVDFDGRQTDEGIFVDGEGPERLTQSFFRGLPTCVSLDANGTPYVAAFNYWVPQLGLLSIGPAAAPRVRLNALLVDIPLRPMAERSRSRAFLPGGLTRTACDRETVIASVIFDSSATSPTRRATWIAIDLRDLAVSLASAESSSTEWFGAASGVWGNSAFVVQNQLVGYPRVLEVSIEKSPTSGNPSRRAP